MKKTLSFLLAVMMLLTSLAFTVNAQEEASAPIVFTLVDDKGQVTGGKGRNGECYFSQGTSDTNPEVYTWNTATMDASDGYAVFLPKDGSGMMELDTFPKDKAWKGDGKHTFLVMTVKTDKAAEASMSVVAQGAKYKKSFKVAFTSEWKQIIIDLNDATGWYIQGDDKNYTEVNYSPMSMDGKQVMAGGFRLDLPGNSLVGKMTIDYIGLFGSAEEAKAYTGRATPATREVYTGTVETKQEAAASGGTAVTAPTVDEGSAELGEAVIFTLSEDDGVIEFAKGRNADCYFPKGSSEINPEIYTWGSGTIAAEDGYATFYPGSGASLMEFDSFPADKAWTTKKNLTYLAFMVKSASAAEASINAVSQGNKYKKAFKVKFTGQWQLVILDLNEKTGWTIKNDAGNYDPITYSPMKDAEGNQVMAGGFRLDFPGNSTIANYKFDYIGVFGSIASAKAYKNRQTAESVSVVSGSTSSTGTSAGTTAGGTATAAPAIPAEPEKPVMKDALTRGKDKEVDSSISLVSAVPASIIEDSKIVYKYSKLDAYDEAGKRWNVLDDEASGYLQTWGQGTFENTTAGILKYNSSANGATLFEAHAKKSASIKKHPYMLIGYKTNEDFTAQSTVGFLYTSGNTHRIPLVMKPDGEWHYDIFDLSKLDIQAKGENGKYEVTTDRAAAVEKMALGAFRIDFPVAKGVIYYIDYIGFFANEDEAKEFAAKSEAAAGLDKDNEGAEDERFTYMKGYDDGTFRPGSQMTRAEAATVIARLLADEDVIAQDRETSFTDVRKGDWYYSYVTYLEDLGYLPNYSGEFKPNQNITRGEFIKLAFEAGGLDFSMKRPKYTDLDKNHPYYKEIVFASGTGIVTGYDNGDGTMSFKPDGEITRAEIATVVNRILKIEAAPDAAQEFSDLNNSHWAFGTIMAIASKK